MNSQTKRAASACLVLLATLLVAAMPTAYAQIPMRGFQGDLTSTDDKFLSIDLNGDGKADLLYSRPGHGYGGAYLSHGDGTFHYVPYVSGGTSYNGFNGDLSSSADRLLPIDLNGDGKDDIILYRPGGRYTLRCLSKGDGTLNCDFLTSGGTGYFNFADSMTNGNTRMVAMKRRGSSSEFLVYTPGSGSAAIYVPQAGSANLQNINLTSNSSPTSGTGWQETMTAGDEQVVVLDANGDGSPDLLVFSPKAGTVHLYLNNGNNTFKLSVLAAPGKNSNGFTGNSQDSNAHAIALDLNGDGRQDFLWWQAGSRTVIGFLSNGNGTVTAVNYLTGGTPTNGFQDTDSYSGDNAVALDLNGDGKSDFIWYSPGNSIVTAYISSASGALTPNAYRAGPNTGTCFKDPTPRNTRKRYRSNFLGTAASGFAWYVPGSGTFQAYQPSAPGDPMTYFSFYAYPAGFLSDLSWSVGDLPLKEIVMPGTHDTAMYLPDSQGAGGVITTQWDDVPYQLSNGARYFDFRSVYVHNGPSGYEDPNGNKFSYATYAPSTPETFYLFGHSNWLTDRSALMVLNQIEAFLDKNPNEVAVIDLGGNTSSVWSGTARDESSQFSQVLSATNDPSLIYTQQVACLNSHCTSPAVQPQNMSINQLKAKGRLILIGGPTALSDQGWSWQGTTATQVGYCDDNGTNGRAVATLEIDCINSGGGDAASIHAVRPDFQAADAATQFMHLQAQLTPDGYSGPYFSNGNGPLLLADGSPGDNYGFNNGGDAVDLNNQLMSGTWNFNALNMVSFDGIGHDNIASLLIQRNHQNWVMKSFFNTTFAQPAGALSIGANGDIWAAGSGHSISVFKQVNGAWQPLINSQPNVKKLAVDPQGGVWVLTSSNQLAHYDQNGANEQSSGHQALDVAVGTDGSVWYIGLDGTLEENSGPTNGKPDIYGSVPTQVGTHVAFDNMGHPLVVDNDGYIRQFNGSSWQQLGPGAKGNEIVAGPDGSIFITGYNQPSVARYNVQNNNFDFLQMDAAHIAVEPGGQPWAIRTGTKVIYKGSLDQI